MTTDTAPPAPAPSTLAAPMSELVGGIVSDAQTLMRQQAEMLTAEVREDFRRSKRAAEFGALGVVSATLGGFALIMASAYLLHEQFQYAMWASWGIVGAVFALAGLILGGTSYILLERFNPLPDKTFNALKENVSWITK